MRQSITAILLCLLANGVLAQDARREQVEAAVGDAVAKLHAEILQQPIVRGVTVQDLVDATEGHDRLTHLLRRSQQVGGPRWISGHTTQVQLEISGRRIARALVDLAAAHPKQTPVSAEIIAAALRDWSGRTFTATGTSMAASGVELVRLPPEASGAWGDISDDSRRTAVSVAMEDAVRSVIQSVHEIVLSEGRTVGNAMEIPAVRESLESWLRSRPVTSVTFRDDLRVEVRLAVGPEELAQALRSALSRQRQIAVPPPDSWQRVQREVRRQMAKPVGVGHVPVAQTHPAMHTVAQTSQAPAWVDRTIEVEGTSTETGSRLLAARAAEAEAVERLQEQVSILPLPGGTTLAEAAAQDPLLKRALQRALRRARTHTQYPRDGGAVVQLSLDLRKLWQEIQAAQ